MIEISLFQEEDHSFGENFINSLYFFEREKKSLFLSIKCADRDAVSFNMFKEIVLYIVMMNLKRIP